MLKSSLLEILNLKDLQAQDVLSKLEDMWITEDLEMGYEVSATITIVCPMSFKHFPLDIQICLFQV